MEPERMDLSALALARGSAKWRTLADGIVRAGLAARREERSMIVVLLSWLRPAALTAAIAAVVVLAVGAARGTTARRSTASVVDPAAAVLAWATTDLPPDPATVLRVLGGSHDR